MAEGFVLSISPAMLKRLDEADGKISNLQTTSDKTSSKIIDDFRRMATGVDPFINKLKEAQSLLSKMSSPNISIKGFKETATDGEKAAKATASITESLNKIKSNPIDDINKKISSLKDLLNQATRSVDEYSRKMASVKSTGSGIISGTVVKEGGAGAALIPQIQAQIAALEQEKKSISSSQILWQQRLDALNNSSLATQRQVSDLAKLNESFRTGQSEMQKQANVVDSTADSISKMIIALDKAATSQNKLNDAEKNKQQKKSDTAAERALEKYNNALNKSEVTIANRARKIEALANAERALTKTGRDYTLELAKIRTETERLNKANVDAANATNKLKSNQSGLVDTAGQLKRQLALLFSVSQIEGYVMKLVNIRGEFELQQKALQAIIQNKTQANELFNQITTLAVQSPFRVKELIKYTKELSAYRVETSKLYDTTKMLADVSAGLGVDMSRLILAYGQVKAANYLRGTELRQFSEAGINILGELATYYSELEGRMVKVAEVQEMVTKRMVSFGDVEEIFKRITSAGGIFYNMQEIQAETLRGQLSNLYDSIDLMFNSIGESNEGVLKGSISMLKTIVENWQVLADIVTYIAVPSIVLYAGRMILAAAANGSFSASTIAATAAQKGFIGMTAKTITGIKGIGAAIASNPIGIIATALASAGFAMYEMNQRVQENKKRYDDLNITLNENQKMFNKSVDAIKRQNEVIKGNNDIIKDNSKNEEEHSLAQENLNKGTVERNRLIAELMKNNPEYYEQIKNNIDSTEDLERAQANLNRQLEITKTLNYVAKEQEGMFSDGVIRNAEELDEAISSVRKEAGALDSEFSITINKINELTATNKEFASKYKKDIDGILNSGNNVSKMYEDLATLSTKMYKDGDESAKDFLSALQNTGGGLYEYNHSIHNASQATANLKEDVNELVKTFMQQQKIFTEDGFVNLSQQQQQRVVEDAQFWLKEWRNSSKEVQQVFLDTFKEYNVPITFTIKEPEKELSFFGKTMNEFIKKQGLSIKLVDANDEDIQYLNKLKSDYSDIEKEIKRASTASIQLKENMTNEEYLVLLKKQRLENEQIQRAAGVWAEKVIEAGKDDIKTTKDRISLIKEMNSQYEKLLQNYNKEAAANQVRSSYKDTFAELFKGTEMEGTIATMDFDVSGAIAALEKLLKTATGKARFEMQKALDGLIAIVDVDVQVKRTDDLKSELEDLFSGYELSLELEKLNIPPELAKQIFNVDYVSLDELQNRIISMKSEFEKQGDHGIKIWEDSLRKIADLNDKRIKEDAKRYTEYLLKSKDERIRIEEEAERDIAKMKATKRFQPFQEKAIEKDIRKEASTKIAKVDYEELKATDLYKKSFEDLERIGTTTLNLMLVELEQFAKKSGQHLPINEFKELMNNIKKMREEVEARDPFASLIEGMIEYKKSLKELEIAEEEYALAKKGSDRTQAEKETAEAQVEQAQGVVDTAPEDEKYAAASKLWVAQMNLTTATNAATEADEKKAKASKKVTDAENKKTSALKKAETNVDRAKDAFEKMSNAINEGIDLAKGLADGLGMSFSPETEAVINSIGKAIAIVVGAMSLVLTVIIAVTAASATMMAVLWPLLAIALALAAVFAIVAIGDAKKDKQIKEEQDRVEKLERAYKKLEKAIKGALSIDELKKTTDDASKNIDAQIASYQSMISAEEGKKKTDDGQIKEWQNTIQDLQEQRDKLQVDIVKAMGGFGGDKEAMKDAAQDFADAWYDAYKETGDGLTGLNEQFGEFIDNVVKKQIMLRGVGKMLEPLFKMVDKMFDSTSEGAESVTKGELDKIKEYSDTLLPQLDKFMKDLMDSLGIAGGSDSDLSGIQRGIQGVSEETAQALESLLNSMRFFVSDSNTQIKNIYALFSNPDAPNPILSELKAQTVLVRSIYDLFNGMTAPHFKSGGRGLKVILD